MHTTTDVLIIGAGTAGLTAALELRRRNISCLIIDKYSEFPESSRALGVQPRTLEIFDNQAIHDDMIEISIPLMGRLIYQNGKEIVRDTWNFQKKSDITVNPPRYRMLLANQSHIEAVLRHKLAEYGTRVELEMQLEDLTENPQGVQATITHLFSGKTEYIRAKWVIGCDGAHSTVRKLLQLSFDGKDYPGYLAQADAYIEGNLSQDFVTMWLSDNAMTAAFPFKDSGKWRIITRVPANPDGSIPEASVELFQQVLTRETHDPSIKITQAIWLSNFMIRHRLVDHFRKGHVFVAGDAAHVHSPAGGQGMNTSIQDTYNLAWKLALVIKGIAPESLLDTYEAERLPVAESVLKMTDFNQRLRSFGGDESRGILMKMISQITPSFLSSYVMKIVFKLIMKRATQLKINYRNSTLSCNIGKLWLLKRRILGGDRAPNGILLDTIGQKTSLFHQFHNTDFRLIIFQGTEDNETTESLLSIARQFQHEYIKSIIICTENTVISTLNADDNFPVLDTNIAILNDPQNYLHKLYGVYPSTIFLVRPDGYIGFRADSGNTAELIDYLRDTYGITPLPDQAYSAI